MEKRKVVDSAICSRVQWDTWHNDP